MNGDLVSENIQKCTFCRQNRRKTGRMGQLYPTVCLHILCFVANGAKSPHIYTRAEAHSHIEASKKEMKREKIKADRKKFTAETKKNSTIKLKIKTSNKN